MKKIKQITCLTLLTVLFFACSSSNSSSNGCLTCTYTLASGETAGTVPADLIGVHNLTLQYSQNGYTFSDGTKATFTITAKQMTVEIDGADCILLENPTASANQVEFTFTDNCRDNLKYSASISSNGGINEVNVGTLSGTFYGQFH